METDPRNKLNDLTAKEWIASTVSVFTQKGLGKGSNEARFEKLHPAPYSFTDVSRFVSFFTKEGGSVLDPFGGVASTAKASALMNRFCTSVEISPYFADISQQRLAAEMNEEQNLLVDIINADIRDALPKLPKEKFDLLLTSPPYWSILNKVDHKAKQERVDQSVLHNYGENDGDLSNIEDYEVFLKELSKIFTKCATKVKLGGHGVIIVGDFRHKSKYYMFHSDLAGMLEKQGKWALKGIKIMYQRHKRVFPYGYPFAYVPNLHHQYALVLKRVEKGK